MIQTAANTPRANDYYRRKLGEAACVDFTKDSPVMVSAKMSMMWRQYESWVTHSKESWRPTTKNLFKLAVDHDYESFINDAIAWGFDFNKVDQADGFTVLDHVQQQLKANKGKPSESRLKNYYAMLERAGAKHKKNLQGH